MRSSNQDRQTCRALWPLSTKQVCKKNRARDFCGFHIVSLQREALKNIGMSTEGNMESGRGFLSELLCPQEGLLKN